MCSNCSPQQKTFSNLVSLYGYLISVKGHGPHMWLKNYSSRSRDLRALDGTVLAIYKGTGIYSSSCWTLRTPADDVIDSIPSGYETEDRYIRHAGDVFDLLLGGIQ